MRPLNDNWINKKVSYTLPLSSVHKFSELFNDIEHSDKELNIESVSISMTSLEEVFLHLAESDHNSALINDMSINTPETADSSRIVKI